MKIEVSMTEGKAFHVDSWWARDAGGASFVVDTLKGQLAAAQILWPELRGCKIEMRDDSKRRLATPMELFLMIRFLRDHCGECIFDHPKWIEGMDKLLDGKPFDASTLIAANEKTTAT
jgi:hypothetical protein